MEEKGGRGYPYCTLMSADGKVIWEARPTSEEAFDSALAKAGKLVQIMDASAKKPEDKVLAANASLLHALGCQQRAVEDFDGLVEMSKIEGIDKEILAEFEGWRGGKSVDQAMQGAANQEELEGKLLDLYKGGLVLPDDNQYATILYFYAARGALSAGDGKTAKEALARVHKAAKASGLDQNPRFVSDLEDLKAKIGELKDG